MTHQIISDSQGMPSVASTDNASSAVPTKLYFKYDDIHKLCQNAAEKIKNDQFQPDLILAIGGGGYIPARMLRTHLSIPIKTVSLELYNDITKQAGDTVKMTQWVSDQDVSGKTVLIVDEVDDTRTTLSYCVNEVRKMNPSRIGVFVVHNKLKNKRVCSRWQTKGYQQQESSSEIDYYMSGQDLPDRWVVYPWDSNDIETHSELAEKRVLK